MVKEFFLGDSSVNFFLEQTRWESAVTDADERRRPRAEHGSSRLPPHRPPYLFLPFVLE